ncbi:MAG: DUF1800 domain-containing protein [Rhodospirillales bacterium]|nr:MAG: DUF1800 domain-containing protein [Rhodospirillales bacterium]
MWRVIIHRKSPGSSPIGGLARNAAMRYAAPIMNRLFLLLFLLLAAYPAEALTFDEARHLLARTGFGSPSRLEIERLLQYTHESAVEEIFGFVVSRPFTQPPPDIDQPLPARGERQDANFRKDINERGLALKSWWWGEMLATDSPFTEHMVLFWHNHFTSSLQKVKWPGYLYRQNLLFRDHALGNFGQLLKEIARDPAMVLYLDGQANRKSQPNENFARELMELFTLGEGHYGERDVKEAARAFTGWSFDPRSGEVVFNPKQHDPGIKQVLGRNVRSGEEVVQVLLDHPETAKHLTRKFWREFVSPEPDEDEVLRLAGILRENNYEIRPLLKAILTLPAFWDSENRGSLVKSPVDLTVGSLRLLGIKSIDGKRLAQAGKILGQDLFDPPNVKGWPGGVTWINSTTLSRREQLLRRLARGREMEGGADPGLGAGYNPLAVDNPSIMPSLTELDREASPRTVATLKRLLLSVPPVDPVAEKGITLRRAAQHLFLDPAYQVK